MAKRTGTGLNNTTNVSASIDNAYASVGAKTGDMLNNARETMTGW